MGVSKLHDSLSQLAEGALQQEYASKAAPLLDLQAQLLNLGLDTMLPTPRIVVCGDQSAGKSSVVQRICGVNLPRSHGTCTRCPIEVRLRRAPPRQGSWSCEVTIRRQAGGQGPSSDTSQVVTDPAGVEEVVRQAQDRALQSGSGERLPFSRDVVVLTIHGADADLTLIDLPGLIHSHDCEPHMVQLTKALTIDYISDANTIIVAVISCKNDVENQIIWSMAKEHDKGGERTLGVLTKVDEISAGCHGSWVDMMYGRKYTLQLGYVMLKNPDQVELSKGTDHQAAMRSEMSYFCTTAELRGLVEDKKVTSRMGVGNLKLMLSRLLLGLLHKALPEMMTQVEQRLNDIHAALQDLPQPADREEVAEYVRERLEHTSRALYDVTLNADISGTDDEYVTGFKAHILDLGRKMASTSPCFEVSGGNPVSWSGLNMEELTGPGGLASYASDRTVWDFSNLQDLINKHRGVSLPLGPPSSCITKIVKESQQHWPAHAQDFITSMAALLQSTCSGLCSRHFHEYPRLSACVSNFAAELVDDYSSSASKVVQQLCKAECTNTKGAQPLTTTPGIFLQTRSAALACITTAAGLYGRVLTPQEQEAADVMASSMAYFMESNMMLRNSVVRAVRYELVVGFADHFLRDIQRRFEAENSSDGTWAMSPLIEELTLEDPAIKEQLSTRSGLEAEQKALTGIKQRLHSICSH